MIQANYVNPSGGGPQAYQSDIIPSSYGFIAWKIQKEWLKDQNSNNVTLFITSIGDDAISVSGPTLMVTNTPPPPTYHGPPTPMPQGQSLYIALPVVFGFILLMLFGGCYLNSRRRRIGLGNIMSRSRGYGIRKSRTERLGKNGGTIHLEDRDLHSGFEYRDAPQRVEMGTVSRERQMSSHFSVDSDDGLESLASTPTEDRRNCFEEELKRQREKQRTEGTWAY